jgi:Phage integrase family
MLAAMVLGGLRRCELLGSRTCHELRHTCLTRLREAGMALEAVQAQAGHASIESTRIYLHLADDWLAPSTARRPRSSTRSCSLSTPPRARAVSGARSGHNGMAAVAADLDRARGGRAGASAARFPTVPRAGHPRGELASGGSDGYPLSQPSSPMMTTG